MRWVIPFTIVVVLVVGSIVASIFRPTSHPDQSMAGSALYAEHCSSCHGANLEGQPNWRTRDDQGYLPAPPHDATGHTWHHSDQQLLRLVRDGIASISPGYQTRMPEFGEVLTDLEIQSILDYFKTAWPEREREFQASRTRAELAASAQ
jgi:mono/diheme cytochrome c family protein